MSAIAEPREKSVSKVEYPNFWSKLIVGPMFDRQFIVPEDPPRFLEGFLKWYEQNILRPNASQIKLDRPIFLIGLPRSGTTMLQDLICTHPQLAYITNAMHQFRKCFCAAESFRKHLRLNVRGQRYLGDSVTVEAGTPAEAVGFWMEWLKWDLYSLEYKPHRLQDFSAEHVESVKLALRKVLWCFGPPATRFFSKNPGLVPEVSLLKELFPDAKFIHIVRDPRNCANSLLKLYRTDRQQLAKIRAESRHGIFDEHAFTPYPRTPNLTKFVEEFGEDSIRCTAHLWNDAVTFVSDRQSELAPNYMEVRHEDVCQNPRQEVSRILEFCELDPIAEDNRKYWDLIEKVGVLHHSNKYSDFDIIEEICGELMRKYGYL